MKRYGIIGGTFDPVHNAHLYIAYESQKQLGLDEIIFMPAKVQPFKVGKESTEAELRYKMVELAVSSYEGFKVSDYEIKKSEISYTYKTLEHVRELINDEDELFFITGADCLLDIDKWKNISEIFSLCHFVVFGRGGIGHKEIESKKKETEEKYNTHIKTIELRDLQISSTDIRERVKNNERIDFFVPEKVNQFIKEHKLYT